MKCCGSPITSIAVSAPDERRIAEPLLQGVLFSQILKPLAAGLGPVGEVAVDVVAQRLFGPRA